MREYLNLDEALKDIGYRDEVKRFQFSGNSDKFEKDLGNAILWLEKTLEQKRPSKENRCIFISIFGELTQNSYKYGAGDTEGILAEIYIGEKGLLFGTKQKEGFLTKEQIEFYKKGQKVPQQGDKTKLGSGLGIEWLIEDGNGILINEKEKEVYISKYL